MKSWLTLLGCSLFALPVFAQLNLTFEKTDPSCFSYTNGIAIVHASGGAEPYTYHWQNGLTFNQYWGIPAGSYSVTVTDADGASKVGSVTLNHPPLMQVSIDAVDIFCEGFNGSLTAKAVGGTPPYNYQWNNGMAEATAFNITEGDWMVTVLDSKQCHDVGTRYVDIPSQIFPNIVPVHPTCATCNNGAIVVSTFGNHPPFNYSWGNGNTSTSLSGLAPGDYPLTVSDQNGCALAFMTALNSPFPPITVTTQSQDALCFGLTNGVVEAIVSGGSGVHDYAWKDQNGQIVGTDGLLQNMAPGTYCVTVTDNTGTTGTACATVNEPLELKVTISITPTATGGTLNINATGGIPPYKMTLDGAMINSTTINLPPKNYYYLCVMDANGCQLDIPFEILPVTACLTVAVSTTSTQCASANTGVATAIVSGGSGNFQYAWSNGGPAMATQTGLAGGTYTVTVTDLNDPACTATASGTVISHTNIVVSATATDASCSGIADGSATASAFNGQAPYTFSWMPGNLSGQTVNGLLPGSYQVTATDNIGCSSTTAVNIGTGSAPNAAFSVGSIICNGATSTIQLVNNSTNANLAASVWNIPGNPLFTGTTPPAFSAPSGQAIVVQLAVSNGTACTDTESKPIDVPAGPSISVPASIKKCDTQAAITVTGDPNYTYSWSPATGLNDVNLQNPTASASGTYTVTATAPGGCTTAASVVVELTSAIAVSLVETPIDPCDKNASVTATAAGATTYSWTLNGAAQTATGPVFTATNLPTGISTIILTASNGGCTGIDTIEVSANPLPSLSLTGDTEKCLGDPAVMISVTPAPPGATYDWDPVLTNDPTQMINSPVAAGPKTYSVTVTNSDGCTQVLTKTINWKEKIDIPLSAFKIDPCNDRFVKFTKTSTEPGNWNFGDLASGAANNTSTLDDPTHVFSAPGNYTVTFDPTEECANTVSIPVTVSNADIITAAFDATLGPDCSTTIELALKDKSFLPAGTTIYSWMVNTVPPTTSTSSNPPVITINQNGTYTINLIVQSAAGCLDTLTQTATVTDLITPPSLASPTLCPGDCAFLNPTGNPNYNYMWSGGLTGTNPSVCPTATTTYTVKVTNNNNCVLNVQTTVTVSPAAEVNAGDSVSVCNTNPVTLTATGNGNFCWSLNPNFVPCLSSTSTATIDPATVSTVYVQSTVGSCKDVDTIKIVNNILNITGNPASSPIYHCLNAANLPTTFGVKDQGLTLTYKWSNGMTVDMLTESPTATTTYSVTATNAAGCTDELSFLVEVIDLQPQIGLTAMKYEVCPNEQVPLTLTTGNSVGPFTYIWTGAGLDCDTCQNPIASPTDSTTYSVTVTDMTTGCTVTAEVRLRYINVEKCKEPFIFLPNAFTPFDGNEYNNVLKVRGNNIESLEFYIYDRWGEKMFETTNPNEGWDGRFKDKELTPDAYGFYLRVTCDDGSVYKKQGNVTILR